MADEAAGDVGKRDRLVRDQPPEAPSNAGPLTPYNGQKPPAPAWFEDAIAAPYETEYLDVEGARIHYQRWGKPDRPGLLLCHGNGAHAHWWDFVAPYFADDWHVVAMTFSGMGESGWREKYDMATFAREQIAVCEATGMFDNGRKPIICAHSFGGFVTIVTGAEYGDRLAGTILLDSPVNPPERQHKPRERRDLIRPTNVYPTLEKALSRFRLAPSQPCENHYALDYIARWSLTKAPLPDARNGEEGWTWKFDPAIWRRFEIGRNPADLLRETKCRLAIFRGEESSLMPDDVGDYMQSLLGHQVPFISIPEARHHLMLDQPLAFVAALRTLLAEWRHSDPHRSI